MKLTMNLIINIDRQEEYRYIQELEKRTDIEAQRILRYYKMPDLSRKEWNPLALIIQKLKSLDRYKNHIEITIPEIVGTYETFDLFDFAVNHPARSISDTYYVDKDKILRTHTSIMWYYLFQNTEFKSRLEADWEVTAISHWKVYRKDEIDRKHSNVFHQVDWIYVCSREKKILWKEDLEELLVELAKSIFGEDIVYRVLDDKFPYTEPSLQIEINIMWDWIELLWSGVLKTSVLNNLWLDWEKYNAIAFGPGIDRMAMIKLKIPDIRLLWSDDPRVIKQFSSLDNVYQEISRYPSTYRDISFIISKDISLNNYYEIIQDLDEGLIEEVVLLDQYENADKFGQNKISYTFRVIYRSLDRTLTNDEVNQIQGNIREKTKELLQAQLR